VEDQVEFENKKGQKLVGILHEPKEKTDKAVVIAHTFKGDKDYQPILEAASEFLAMNKIAVLRFDFAGAGESEGDYKNTTLLSEVDDLRSAIKFVESRGYKKIGLIGFSIGAIVSLIAYNSKIRAIVLWSPLLNPMIIYDRYKKFEEEFKISKFIVKERKIDKKKVRIGIDLFNEWKNINMVPFIETVECPVLFVVAGEDKEICNREENLEMLKYFPNKKNKLIVVEGADHDFLDKEKARKVILATRNWLRKFLD
jgi:alpha/beta superfamily hydrolase